MGFLNIFTLNLPKLKRKNVKACHSIWNREVVLKYKMAFFIASPQASNRKDKCTCTVKQIFKTMYVFGCFYLFFLPCVFSSFFLPGLWISYSYAIFWSQTFNRSCTQHRSSYHWCFQCWICSSRVYSCLSPKCSLCMDLCCFTCSK